MRHKICLIICWFGDLPDYIDIWSKTCETNIDFDFLFFTDAETTIPFPKNVKLIPFTITEFKKRIQKLSDKKVSLKRAYRICDFRPCYGEIFREELKRYDFWGYCDIDLVFGNLREFITDKLLQKYDAVFNGGHFSLLRNCEKINKLFLMSGGAFPFETVYSRDAIFAFDETTGIQAIAKKNNIKALYLIPYIETEIRFKQLRSRLEIENPDNQAFFWENGELYRVKESSGDTYYQKIAYIHLQKRKLSICGNKNDIKQAFWITPTGFEKKYIMGLPSLKEIKDKNPFDGVSALRKQNMSYKIKKIFTILKRNPFQIYVRLVQERCGINKLQGTLEEREWVRY